MTFHTLQEHLEIVRQVVSLGDEFFSRFFEGFNRNPFRKSKARFNSPVWKQVVGFYEVNSRAQGKFEDNLLLRFSSVNDDTSI